MTEYLEPVGGRGTTFQPASYADHGYVISDSIAVVDSVQSQANRLEGIFKEKRYSTLVPQVTVNDTNLLEVGHRLADATMAYSSANPVVRKAFEAATRGDFTPLAKINPTALALGIWDSRSTSVKIPRALGFTVDAFGVKTVRDRAAQYRASISAETKAMLQTHRDADEDATEKKTRSRLSEEGFNDIPSFNEKLGGIIADEVVRKGVLNLTALRGLGDDKLQNYIYGLALVMFTYPMAHDYRSSTLLVQDAERSAQTQVVYRNGRRETVEITHEQALAFARRAALDFGVGENQAFVLNDETYKKYQKTGAEEKKAARKTKTEKTLAAEA